MGSAYYWAHLLCTELHPRGAIDFARGQIRQTVAPYIEFHSTVIYELAITAKGFPTQWVSDSVKRIFGYEVEEALAPDWWIDCLHPDDKAAAIKKTSLLMSQGQLVQEYRFRCKDGHYLWIQDEASLLRKADGQPKEIVGFGPILQIASRRKHGQRKRASKSLRGARCLGLAIATLQSVRCSQP